MKLIAIIFILLIPIFNYANYSVSMGNRGIVFEGNNKTTAPEAELCSEIRCIFVSYFELSLLGLNLGDNAQEILKSLQKMDNIDRGFLFYQLDNLDNIYSKQVDY